MTDVMFFCIPAHGHTNPTLKVVEALVRRDCRVRYFSFEMMRDKIEAAGAAFIPCDGFLPPEPVDLEDKVGRDFASLIEMVADTTLNLEDMVAEHIRAARPDVIVSDSVCFWGKLFALRYGIPFVCSTTTFAYNKHTARLMKQSPLELVRMVTGMPRINAAMARLRAGGYPVKDFISVIQNDNDTPTVVYTSRHFQPMAETFSDRYAFVGPLPRTTPQPVPARGRHRIYVSMGSVLNKNTGFFMCCAEALGGLDADITISADIQPPAGLPANIKVYPWVDQMAVLAESDLFVTHCGMNSVSESLYMGVPMVLFPQHAEEYAVAVRAEELGAGVRIKKGNAGTIRRAAEQVLAHESYRRAAQAIREEFLSCGGAEQAAEYILMQAPETAAAEQNGRA